MNPEKGQVNRRNLVTERNVISQAYPNNNLRLRITPFQGLRLSVNHLPGAFEITLSGLNSTSRDLTY